MCFIKVRIPPVFKSVMFLSYRQRTLVTRWRVTSIRRGVVCDCHFKKIAITKFCQRRSTSTHADVHVWTFILLSAATLAGPAIFRNTRIVSTWSMKCYFFAVQDFSAGSRTQEQSGNSHASTEGAGSAAQRRATVDVELRAR